MCVQKVICIGASSSLPIPILWFCHHQLFLVDEAWTGSTGIFDVMEYVMHRLSPDSLACCITRLLHTSSGNTRSFMELSRRRCPQGSERFQSRNNKQLLR